MNHPELFTDIWTDHLGRIIECYEIDAEDLTIEEDEWLADAYIPSPKLFFGRLCVNNEDAGFCLRVAHEGTVKHMAFYLRDKFRGLGIARTHLMRSAKKYQQAGFHTIELDTAEDGIYTWPRYGFDFTHPVDEKYNEIIIRRIIDPIGHHIGRAHPAYSWVEDTRDLAGSARLNLPTLLRTCPLDRHEIVAAIQDVNLPLEVTVSDLLSGDIALAS